MKIVIAGGSVAAFESAWKLRNTYPAAEIDLFSDESVPPYRRPALPMFIAQMTDDPSKIWIRPPSFYAENRINLHLDSKVTAIFPSEKTVTVNNEITVKYDKLILAVGGAAWVPDLPGAAENPPLVLRSLADAQQIRREIAAGAESAVIIGGGVLGVELAEALEKRGLSVQIVETACRLRVKDMAEEDAAKLQEKLFGTGKIKVFCNAKVSGFGKNSVFLDGGTELAGSLIICAAGSRPALDCLKDSGVAIDRGVVVDAAMHTNLPDVYACGDAAQFDGQVCGLYITARKMALALEL